MGGGGGGVVCLGVSGWCLYIRTCGSVDEDVWVAAHVDLLCR